MQLLKQVVQGGYCIGCGACASANDSRHRIQLTDLGQYEANLIDGPESCDAVCPFTGTGPNEDEIGREIFGDTCTPHPKIGYHSAVYAGHVEEGDYRAHGTSGGGITWICDQLLRKGFIDHVIHVKPHEKTPENPVLFEYAVSSTSEQVRNGAKSRYYPVEISKVMAHVRENPGRYAFVGIPCFVKAVRLLAMSDPVIKDRISFCIGVICGHLKSARYADLLAWQDGIPPENVAAIDFRFKLEGLPASSYGFSVLDTKVGKEVSSNRPTKDYFGTDWGMGFMQYNACDYCDDVLGETADISFGDAWLPQYDPDSMGTNVVVIRNKELGHIVAKGIADGALKFDEITAEMAAQSQSGGLRHRRVGLSYRLFLADQKGIWRPQKRVKPDPMIANPRLRQIFECRMRLRSTSHLAFRDAVAVGDFGVFVSRMQPMIARYRSLARPKWSKRWSSSIRNLAKKILKAILGRQ